MTNLTGLGDIIYVTPNEVRPMICFEACIVAIDREGFSICLSADTPESRIHFTGDSPLSDHKILRLGLEIGTYCMPFHSQDKTFLVEHHSAPPNRPRHRRT